MQNTGRSENLIARIRSLENSFTRAERAVAEAVLADPQAALFATVTDLAERAQVGETTVLRFCRTLGCRGFQEFKLTLARDLAVGTTEPTVGLLPNASPADLATALAEQNAQALRETVALLDPTAVEQAIAALDAARRIQIYGVGVSGLTAQDAKAKFLRIGLAADAIPDPHLAAMSAALLGPGDVAVGVSVSGSTRDTVDCCRLAKDRGATVICITTQARSPITQVSHITLLAAGREAPLQGGSMAAKMAQLLVIDVLFTGVAMRRRAEATANIERTAAAVVEKFY